MYIYICKVSHTYIYICIHTIYDIKYSGILSKLLGIIIIHSGHTTPVFLSRPGDELKVVGLVSHGVLLGRKKTYRILNLNQMQ